MATKNKPTQRAIDVGPTAAVGPQRPGARPSWTSRTFGFRGGVVKRFGRVAPEMEALLNALEQDNWTRGWINNPFASEPGRTSKQRLHDAVQNFNRRLDDPCIALRTDGHGLRFRWEET